MTNFLLGLGVGALFGYFVGVAVMMRIVQQMLPKPDRN